MRPVSDIENALPETGAPSRSKSPTNRQAPPARDWGPPANPRHRPTFCRTRTHCGERLYAWLTTQSGANLSAAVNSLFHGKIQGISRISDRMVMNYIVIYAPLQ
jgi:hypothetical protein